MSVNSRTSAIRLARVAAEELRRAQQQMRIPDHPRPFYLSFLIREEERWRIQAKYGSLRNQIRERARNAYVDVRVGSYRADQIRGGGLEDNDKEAESFGYVELPFGDRMDGVRHGLWRLSDARYREAVSALLDKQSHQLTYLDPHRHLSAFERRAPIVDLGWRPFPEVDEQYWADYVVRASATVKRYPDIHDAAVEFHAEHICKTFVNSEGSTLIQCQPIWYLEGYIWLLAPDGHSFPWTVRYMVGDPAELPDRPRFEREIRAAVATLRRLAAAPTVRAFCGPALLEPVPAGLLMHEAVGHRLEGNRLLASGEGQTFRDAVGRQILPSFLSLRDDPSRERWGDQSLVGHYRYDDEGVAAQDTELVRRGRLKGFLTTRTRIARRHRATGHARSDYHQRPISRMGNLIVETEDGHDEAGLKRILLEEIRKQGSPFGVRIVEATSGETATDAYNFQAFLGEARLATRVFPDGREEWIRGINFVGTPLNAIRSIVAAGKRYEVDNAWCGAESGDVPVSTVSPALVVSELELQSRPDQPYTQFSYPSPWAAGRVRSPRIRGRR